MMRYYTEDFARTPDGADLWYALIGEGEPVLVTCDGLGCDGFAWKHLKRLLSPKYRVLRFNYRGHGRSGVPTDPSRIGIETSADDLAFVLDHAKIDKAVILGHSMGVQVALEFHRRHPERTLALVPICGSYGNPLDTVHDQSLGRQIFPYIYKAVERFPRLSKGVARTLMPAEISFQYALWAEVNRHLIRREDFEPYFAHLAVMDPMVFARTLEAAAAHTAWDHLPKVDVPTLIIAAQKDRFTPMWLSQRMHQAIPHSELLVLSEGTHTAVIELPERIAERIERFVEDRVRPAMAA